MCSNISSHQPRSSKVAFARLLRQRQTSGEKMLWSKLRDRRFHGCKFRRQVPVGLYVADFLCTEHSLIIEVDGRSHFEPGAEEYDIKRDAYLFAKGFRVIRIRNMDVLENIDGVLESIAIAIGIDVS